MVCQESEGKLERLRTKHFHQVTLLDQKDVIRSEHVTPMWVVMGCEKILKMLPGEDRKGLGNRSYTPPHLP